MTAAADSDLGQLLTSALADAAASRWPRLDELARDRLLHYVDLLLRWNGTYNLTAVREPVSMLYRHLLDCLSLTPFVGVGRLLDVGTGPGLPGLVLAVVYPSMPVVLLDASLKKARFCSQAVTELGLSNVVVSRARVQSLHSPPAYQHVVSRAFGSAAAMWTLTRELLAPGGCMLAMKGRVPAAELAELRAMGENPELLPLSVPGLDEERHLVMVRRKLAS